MTKTTIKRVIKILKQYRESLIYVRDVTTRLKWIDDQIIEIDEILEKLRG